MDLVMQNWKLVVGGVVVLFLAGKALLPKLKSIKWPKSTKVDISKIEISDQQAISHLRNRAVFMGNKELIEDIKKIASHFYDIHCEALSKELK